MEISHPVYTHNILNVQLLVLGLDELSYQNQST